jgi:hypothetical protein
MQPAALKSAADRLAVILQHQLLEEGRELLLGKGSKVPSLAVAPLFPFAENLPPPSFHRGKNSNVEGL